VTDSYLPQLREAVAGVVGPRQITVTLADREQGELFPELVRAQGSEPSAATAAGLNARYSFASFVVGASNQFAHAAARAVATQPGVHYNPLFIYGGVGLGKTHLLHAIGHEILRRQPLARVLCLSCDAFMTDLIAALRRDRVGEFKERLRRVDALLLDDIQTLSGRERTQEEFFHTFNALHGHHRQIVLTSDKVPKDIPHLAERLRNRFEWGLIADIQAPDVETRVAILQRRAEFENIVLPVQVALLLAERVPANVRELEGALTRLAANASLMRQPITEELALEVLRGAQTRPTSNVSFDQLIDAVCAHFSVRTSELLSKRRSRHLVTARQVGMYLARELLAVSYPQLGVLYHRDHSTVIHAISVVDQRRRTDPGFEAMVDSLRSSLVSRG
jgi:chromosomal replication initiator protein